MRRLPAFVTSLLVSFAFLPAYLPVIEAEATAYPVQLNAAQSLALFGNSIPAKYYDGSSVNFIDFSYVGTTKTLCNSLLDTFESSPFLSPYIPGSCFALDFSYWSVYSRAVNAMPDWFSSASGKQMNKSDIASYEFLIYKWTGQPSPVPSSGSGSFDFQIFLDQSLSLSNVERFRFCVGYSVANIYDMISYKNTSASNINSTYNIYTDGNTLTPTYTTANLFRNSSTLQYFSCAYLPLANSLSGHHNVPVDVSTLNECLTPCPQMALMAYDSGTLQTPISIDKHDILLRGAAACTYNRAEYTEPADYAEPAVYIILMCPQVWGEITPPVPQTTEPNYSSQLDDIGSGVTNIEVNLDGTNDRLDIIIEKLDDIYEKMCEENGGVELVPPDEIGINATAKQRVISGLSNLDSQMDDVSAQDMPQDAMNGFSNLWSEIKTELPSGLMPVYMLALVGGIISWIIYGKRGG